MKGGALETEPTSAVRERAMTLDRDETKYVIHPLRVRGVLALLEAKLVRHRYSGEGANRLPDAQHYTTTVYFDTSDRALYRAARQDPEHNEKLRARAYYDVHSSLAELATSSDQFVRRDPWIFLELKRRDKTRTSKHRLRLAPDEFAQFLQDGSGGEGGTPDDRLALTTFLQRHHEPLAPSCVVSYRRVSFEDEANALRVTLDLDVGFFAAPAQVLEGKRPLTRASFGKASGSAPMCMLELKRRGEAPAWLLSALEAAGAKPESFSKFILASEAVHGPA